MHVPGRGHDPPGAEPAAGGRKRHRLQRLHPDGHDGRERGRAMQGQPRGPGRVGGDFPGACGRGARRRPVRPRDRGGGHTRNPRCRRRRDRRTHGHQGRRASPGHNGGVAVEAEARLQARWQCDRRQLVPPQRRRRGRAGDVGGEGPRARASSRGPGSSRPRWRQSVPRSWASRRSRRSGRSSSRPA